MKPNPFPPSKTPLLKPSAFLALGVFLFFTLSLTAHAQGYLGDGWDKYLGPLKTFTDTGQTGEELAIGFIKNGIVIVRYLIGAVALILGSIYAIQLVFSQGNEEAIDKQKQNFLWALVGFVVLIIAENVANIFNPETSTATQLVDFGAARDQLRDIVNYMKWIVGSVIVLFMTITGVRMVIYADEEEELNKQKLSLTWGGLGGLVVLLASNIVNAIYVIKAPDQVVAAGPESAIVQIAGVIRLVLVFLGPMAILFTLYAGFLYLGAMDSDEQAGKAKQMIIGGVTGIVIIYAAYALVNTITSKNLAESLSLFV